MGVGEAIFYYLILKYHFTRQLWVIYYKMVKTRYWHLKGTILIYDNPYKITTVLFKLILSCSPCLSTEKEFKSLPQIIQNFHQSLDSPWVSFLFFSWRLVCSFLHSTFSDYKVKVVVEVMVCLASKPSMFSRLLSPNTVLFLTYQSLTNRKKVAF